MRMLTVRRILHIIFKNSVLTRLRIAPRRSVSKMKRFPVDIFRTNESIPADTQLQHLAVNQVLKVGPHQTCSETKQPHNYSHGVTRFLLLGVQA